MSSTIVLPVPEMLTAVYLVPTRELVADPIELLRSRLGADRDLVETYLDHDLLQVDVVPVVHEDLPVRLLEIFGATGDQLDELARARYFLLLLVEAARPRGWPALQELGARWAAQALAGPEGTVFDPVTPRLIAGADLVSDEREEGVFPVPMTSLVLVPQSPGERGHWLTTKGLTRFGLPELEAVDVPPNLTGAWTSLLSGLALVLVGLLDAAIEEAADAAAGEELPAFVELDSVVQIPASAVALAYGDDPDAAGDGVARVQLTANPSAPDHDVFLTVRAPDDFGRSAGEFHAEAVEALFGEPERELRRVQGSDDMDAAIATARSCLNVAWHRFSAGEFGQERLLMVKYALDVPDGSVEFPWLYVTAWDQDGRISGASANDVEADPSVRVGRPVTVAMEDVADWGIWVDGDGMVEGGWTNAVLQGEPAPPVPTLEAPPTPEADRARPRRSRWGRRKG